MPSLCRYRAAWDGVGRWNAYVAPKDAYPRANTGAIKALSIDDTLRLALALLRHASDCARDTDAAPWDLAIEIGELYETGLTITDLRWLVVKGFVEHGGETSAYGDAHRSFTCSAGFNFLTQTVWS